MKKSFLNLPFCVAVGLWAMPTAGWADSYPTTSYELSADGKTLVKWTGEESVIDMSSDPAFDQVVTIGEEAFAFNSTFTSITLSQNIVSIETSAFNLATKLESVSLPESLLSIGERAFRKCYVLKSIELPGSLTTIGSLAFEDCEHLEAVTLPNSVTSLGSSAFTDCYALRSVTLSSAITNWGEGSFTYCTSLEDVSIPEGITAVPDRAFYNCYEMAQIELPSTLQSIGEDAFTDGYHSRDKIRTVTCHATTPPVVTDVWTERRVQTVLYVPKQSLAAYVDAPEWNQFGKILPIEGVTDELGWCLVSDKGIKVLMSHVALLVAADDETTFAVLDGEGRILLDGVTRATFQLQETAGIDTPEADLTEDHLLKQLVGGRLVLMGAKGDVDVYTIDGRRVAHARAPQTGATVIDVAHLPAATYIVKNGQLAFKFIKK